MTVPGKPKFRFIEGMLPKFNIWKPLGVKTEDIGHETIVSIAEWEALRLCDVDGFKQREAAEHMHISQPTLNRLLTSARRKIAQGMMDGSVIRFEGSVLECKACGLHLTGQKVLGSSPCPGCDTPLREVNS